MSPIRAAMLRYSFRGASGKLYSYAHIQNGALSVLPADAGNYIFAFGTIANPVPVFIGEAESIQRAFLDSEHWRRAQEISADTLFFLHLDFGSDEKSRREEQADLVVAYDPPLNALPV
jgi:hypothetical protein